jgi:ArsR family transcriptional regulator
MIARALGALDSGLKNRNPVDDMTSAAPKSDRMFELAADIFRVMSAPTRLKIINALCAGEKNVRELLELIDTTQPNMSQHLNVLYKAGIVGRRREGVQIHYRIINEAVVALCGTMCGVVASQAESSGEPEHTAAPGTAQATGLPAAPAPPAGLKFAVEK